MTGVWALLLDRPLSVQEAAELTALLPPERRERLHRMRLPEKRQEVLCAYLILRRALREQYRWQEIPPIACEDGGKPFFPDAPQVQFNLSHTAGAVLAALSDRPVGVDIERIRPLSPLARRRLAEGTSQEAFFADWVRREAVGKWMGAGVRPHGQETVCPPDCRFFPLETFAGYAAGICVSSGAETLEIHRQHLTELL